MECSRSLLFPGAQPPLSHFGATLLRHSVETGLRYTLFHLGLGMPETAPLRLVQLRLYLVRRPLLDHLGETAEGAELAAAWLDPGGIAAARPPRLAAAAAFHRLRLSAPWRATPARPTPPALPTPPTRARLWQHFESLRSAHQRRLNEALLAETVAVLARRRQRARGRTAPPCLGVESWRFVTGRAVTGHGLGVPDPLHPSWAERDAGERPPPCAVPAPPRHRLRGRFREVYRATLDGLRPVYLALAERAVRRGLLSDPRDAFFLPWEVAADLAADVEGAPPAWLPPAVAGNRSEYEALLACEPPPESFARTPGVVTTGAPADLDLAVLTPLA